MKVLTVRQPWAWAIIHGQKRIENRSWPTDYRGPLLIHAGKTKSAIGDEEGMFDLPPSDQLLFGAIIGYVQLNNCLRVEEVGENPFAEGPWCWILSDPRPITPHYCQGKLSLWLPPSDLVI